MRNETPHSPLRLISFVLLALFAAPPSRAAVFTGTSTVGSRFLANNPFPPEWQGDHGDQFGAAVATGDFNNDGADDLAIGAPLDNGRYGVSVDSGIVVVYFGTPGTGVLNTGVPYVLRTSVLQDEARFGFALAACDFNSDGFDDLAVGAPRWRLAADPSRKDGAVFVHYGSAGGIEELAADVLTQPAPTATPYDEYGTVLAAGDFNGDFVCDLAIGQPTKFKVIAAQYVSGGSVWVRHGPDLVADAGFEIEQDHVQIPDVFEAGDDFGFALAVGNFNGDSRCGEFGCTDLDDLAIGVPGEGTDGSNHGRVLVLFGSEFSLLYGSSLWYGQGDLGGVAEYGDRFARSLAAGNFNCDAADDLIVGAPNEDFVVSGNDVLDAGEITVMYGMTTYVNGSWFNINETDLFSQATFYGTGAHQAFDFFGLSVAAGDFDADGCDDAAVGQPGEALGGAERGGFHVLTGSPSNPSGLAHYYQFYSAATPGMPVAPQDFQAFGQVFATGDFGGNGHDDLAIGIPFRNVDGLGQQVGAAVVLQGSLFSDSFEFGSTLNWSDAQP